MNGQQAQVPVLQDRNSRAIHLAQARNLAFPLTGAENLLLLRKEFFKGKVLAKADPYLV